MRRETGVVVSDAIGFSVRLIAYHDVRFSRCFVVISQWIKQPHAATSKHLQSLYPTCRESKHAPNPA